MRIAIIGATSNIARDFVASVSESMEHELVLFARRTEIVRQWLAGLPRHVVSDVDDLPSLARKGKFDAIINYIGIANPSQAAELGAQAVHVSRHFDELCLSHLYRYPDCRYIFLSSGAIYGCRFDSPVDDKSTSNITLNNPRPADWYGISKLLPEYRHRSLEQAAIVDLRIFNYFSHSQSLSSQFLINDILRSIKAGITLVTSPTNIIRDYLHPKDLSELIQLILKAPPANLPLDCYSKAPVEKFTILSAMKERFGLSYEVLSGIDSNAVPVEKIHYYTLSRRAAQFGFSPAFTSLDCVLDQSELLLSV